MAEINSNGTFKQFTSFRSQTAGRLKVMDHPIQKNRQFSKSQRRDGSNTNVLIKKEPGVSFFSAVRTHDRSQLMWEGKCFNCYEQDHLSIVCLKKQKWIEGTWTVKGTEPDCQRLTWRQVSSSARKDVDVVEINLRKLLGGQGFHIDSQLAYNGLSFPMTTLVDIEANGCLFKVPEDHWVGAED